MQSFSRNEASIGVFDSGLGGLTIVRELRARLPHEQILYFGDIARLPYGTKSPEQIRRFSEENTRYLVSQGIKALVIACNSSSSAAYHYLRRHFDLPVIDAISPAVEAALAATRKGRIGVIGTHATIESGAYAKALGKGKSKLKITSVPCPLFVPIVEEGMMATAVARELIALYLEPLKQKKIDTLILGCTHYPLLSRQIAEYMGNGVKLVDSAAPCVAKLSLILKERNMARRASGKGKLKIFVSDLPRNFIRTGEDFLKEKLRSIKIVR